MEIINLFKDSLKYPINNPQQFVIIAILYFIASLPLFFVTYKYGQDNVALTSIFVIIEIIIGFILGGYEISIIAQSSTYSTDEVPKIKAKHNFIMGIKSAIVSLIYAIIPMIIIVVGVLTVLAHISIIAIKLSSSTATNAVASTIPAAVAGGAVLTGAVAIIVAIIFSFFVMVAYGRLGKYDSLSAALNLPEVIKDIGRIGWLKFIAWFIVFVIINIILGLIASVIGLIPYVGIIIASILVETYVLFFTGRAIGLMYSNA